MWWVLIRKNDSLDEWGDLRFILFLGGPLDFLEFRDRKKGVLTKEC